MRRVHSRRFGFGRRRRPACGRPPCRRRNRTIRLSRPGRPARPHMLGVHRHRPGPGRRVPLHRGNGHRGRRKLELAEPGCVPSSRGGALPHPGLRLLQYLQRRHPDGGYARTGQPAVRGRGPFRGFRRGQPGPDDRHQGAPGQAPGGRQRHRTDAPGGGGGRTTRRPRHGPRGQHALSAGRHHGPAAPGRHHHPRLSRPPPRHTGRPPGRMGGRHRGAVPGHPDGRGPRRRQLQLRRGPIGLRAGVLPRRHQHGPVHRKRQWTGLRPADHHVQDAEPGHAPGGHRAEHDRHTGRGDRENRTRHAPSGRGRRRGGLRTGRGRFRIQRFARRHPEVAPPPDLRNDPAGRGNRL